MKPVIILGDSILKGVVYKDDKYIKCENNVVDLVRSATNLEINNLSVFGQTIQKLYSKGIVSKTLENTKNSYIVIELGGNDSDFNWNEVVSNPSIEHDEKTPRNKFYELLVNLVQEIKASGNTPILCTLPPISANKYFNFISKKYDGGKILEFFYNDISNIYRHHEFYSNLIKKCAIVTNTKVLDCRNDILIERNYEKYICDDGIHLNEQGHIYLAGKLIKQIDNLLKNKEF